MERLEDRHMSAMALSTYQSCPLRFRFRYIDRLYWSRVWGAEPEERQALERGQNFHLMARRYYEGLEPGVIADPVEHELQEWLHSLQGFVPRAEGEGRQFYPELELRLNRPGMRLLAKFDLVVVEPDGRATIYDWKTEKRAPRRQRLLRSPQTLVYRYMLCEAGAAYSPTGRFQPDDVSMVYWNPMFPDQWERLTYTQGQFRKDSDTLQQLMSQILGTPPGGFFATAEERICRSCEYRMVCHGRKAEEVERDGAEWEDESALSWELATELP